MKKFLQSILYTLAKLILARHKPKIIGITGSVGKTSTKEAVYAVLKNNFSVRRNIKNYNNEIGLPLTIIGCKSYGKNIFGWLYVFIKALLILIIYPYPKILILEMGADKPGDIKYLTKLAPAYIGILTAIGDQPVHLQNFKNIEQLIKEKAHIITHLWSSDFAIINIDDKQISYLTHKTKAEVMAIGSDNKADLKLSDIHYSIDLENDFVHNKAGIKFKVHYKGNSVPFEIKNILGIPQVYAALNAIAVGLIFKMNLVDIAASLNNYQPPKGRMNLLAGIKETIIIDDSYNSSPLACQKALEVLNKIKVTGRKIACLGNMEELGVQSRRAHRHIGRLIKELNIDILFVVGDKAADIAAAAQEKGLPSDNIFIFTNSNEAKEAVRQELHRGDVILIKGSQSMRMEKISQTIIAEQAKARKLLVRQDKSWLKS